VQLTDPFKNVKGMLEGMINRLLRESAGDAQKNSWCKSEQMATAKKLTTKTAEVDKLTARCEEVDTSLAAAKAELTRAQEAVAAAQQAAIDAEDQRHKEKQANLDAAKQYKDAQALIQNAVSVLQGFYGKALLLQLNQPAAAGQGAEKAVAAEEKMADDSAEAAPVEEKTAAKASPKVVENVKAAAEKAPFKLAGPKKERRKKTDTSSHSILALLSLIAEDYSKMEVQVIAAEREAESSYVSLAQDLKADVAGNTRASQLNEGLIAKLTSASRRCATDKGTVEKEVKAAAEYGTKLEAECTVQESAEDRAARKEKQMRGLEEALKALQ
jgi:hypothetical protein